MYSWLTDFALFCLLGQTVISRRGESVKDGSVTHYSPLWSFVAFIQ